MTGLWEDLRAAFQESGIYGLRQAYHAAERRSLAFRCASRLVSVRLPVLHVLDLVAALDERIGEFGPHHGCRMMFDEIGLEWGASLPVGEEGRLTRSPLLAYGNHPMLLTPFLIVASLDRSDVRLLATSYLARLLPALSCYILPLEPTYARSTRPRLESAFRHQLAVSLLHRMEPEISVEAARAQNRESLASARAHLQSGGYVALAPGGGRSGPWYPGIGTLVKSLEAQGSVESVLLAPFHVENSSQVRVYSLLCRRSKRTRRSLRRPPLRMVFERPLAIRSVLPDLSLSAVELTALLERHYTALFESARAKPE